MIAAQGGDPDAPLPTARESQVVTAAATGMLTRLDALAVGIAAWRLGAGRARKEDPVQAGAGVVMHAKPGDRVQRGRAAADPAHRRARTASRGPRRRSPAATTWRAIAHGCESDGILDRITCTGSS